MISLQVTLCLLCALMCGQVTGESNAVKQAFVDAHNSYRAKVASGSQPGQPNAANMEAVIWNDDIAAYVQAYMDSTKCSGLVHNPNLKSKGYGENAWGGGGMAPPTTDAIKIQYAQDAVTLWFGEVSLYTYPNAYSTGTGHYLQVVWANSGQIGCGFSTCSSNNSTRVFCDYSPPGNYAGKPPYVSGTACSSCPSYRNQCTADGLCYSTMNTSPRVQCYQQTGYGQPVSQVTCAPWFNSCGTLSWTDYNQDLQVSCVVKGATTCTNAGDTFGSASQWCTCDGNLCNPITV